jgi:hypothetical protein
MILNFVSLILSLQSDHISFMSYSQVPLDYSRQSYFEVMFLNLRMKISVQGSLVNVHGPYLFLHYVVFTFSFSFAGF